VSTDADKEKSSSKKSSNKKSSGEEEIRRGPKAPSPSTLRFPWRLTKLLNVLTIPATMTEWHRP
jgi:hypothetical protein